MKEQKVDGLTPAESEYPIRALVKAGSCSWPEEGVGDGSIIQVREVDRNAYESHDPRAPESPFPWYGDELILNPSDSQIREQREKAGWNGDEPPLRPSRPEPRRLESPEAAPAREHDENCFLAMGGGGMCNCSLSKGPEAAPAEGVREKVPPPELRDALQMLVESIEHDGGIETEDWPELEAAKAALSRSEGAQGGGVNEGKV